MPGWLPPTYKTPEEMQVLITKYFQEAGENWDPLTVTGLALALGFTSRQTVLNYEGKPQFMDTIKTAKLMIEHYNEKKLYDKNTPTAGVIFNLANNYKRQNKQTIDTNVREMDPLKEKLKKVMNQE